MKLDKLVTTYEQSRRIQELGFKKESIFSWYARLNKESLKSEFYVGTTTAVQSVNSYTAEELGEILPTRLKMNDVQHGLGICKGDTFWECFYIPGNFAGNSIEVKGSTLAQAMGDMLIYLLENNLLPDFIKDEN